MSFLMTIDFNNQSEIKLYTRGDGTYGQDVTSLLKYVKYPSLKKLIETKEEQYVFRGELIISRKKYDEKS